MNHGMELGERVRRTRQNPSPSPEYKNQRTTMIQLEYEMTFRERIEGPLGLTARQPPACLLGGRGCLADRSFRKGHTGHAGYRLGPGSTRTGRVAKTSARSFSLTTVRSSC